MTDILPNTESPSGIAVPLHRPSIDAQDEAAVLACLRSGWLTTGPRVAAFESAVADYAGVAEAVAVDSGSAALLLALRALGIGEGDEVITTPYGFVASLEAILAVGATPRLVDVDLVSGNIDLAATELAITPATSAILPIHVGGHSCAMDELADLCAAHDLALVADAAHALETRCGPRHVAELGDATAFSFYANKNITSAEGGMIATDDRELAERLRRLRLHGLSTDAWQRAGGCGPTQYDIPEPGVKANMSDLCASLGLSQFGRVESFQRRRHEIVASYQEAFADQPLIRCPEDPAAGRHAWHLYSVLWDEERSAITRDQVRQHLAERGIATAVHFHPLHLFECYSRTLGHGPGDFPASEERGRRVISLPLFPSMTDDEVGAVIDGLSTVAGEAKR